MKYFFILGNNPTLSVAEICAVFKEGAKGNLINEKVFITETNKEVDAIQVIKKMGGIIKMGVIKDETAVNEDEVLLAIKRLLNLKNISGKFNFGISNYGVKNIKERNMGMKIKRYLAENKVSSRLVVSRESILSSVVVEQNKLITRGKEINLIPLPSHKLLLGQTLAVQPFKELSFRDYGRPGRDDYAGMLPPKLAQIMINLSKPPLSPLSGGQEKIAPLIKGGRGDFYKILDPFCGSGTILTEAMLMGHKNLYGSDISEKAVEDTRKNIEWTRKNYELRITNYELFNKDIKELLGLIKYNSIDAIVTEPYLGPSRGRFALGKIKKELEKLYSESLAEFYKILKPGGRVVMVWPVFLATRNSQLATQECVNPNLGGFKIVTPIPLGLQDNKIIKLTNRNTIIYGREGQRVWREIVVLEK